MKLFNLIFGVASLFAGVAFASDFKVSAGASTANMYHGVDLSKRGMSAAVGVEGVTDAGFFVNWKASTVSLGSPSTLNLQHLIDAGYGAKVRDALVSFGLRKVAYTGTALTATNNHEAFLSATDGRFYASVRKEMTHTKNTGVELAYSMPVAENVVAHVGYEYINYGTSRFDYHGVSVGGTYKFSPNLTADVSFIKAGRDAFGAQLPKRAVASISYLF